MLLASFLICLLLFLAIGLSSLFQSKGTADDYLVTGKSTSAWLTGLSAIATNNSGYMFIGMIGLTYQIGLSSIWLMIGWIVGDLAASLMAVPGIRRAARSETVHSFGGLLAHSHKGPQKMLRAIVGIVTVAFLTLYAAAQLKAGAKATAVILDWPMMVGPIVGAAIVLLYSAAGGLRASIWTDAAQSFVMIFGMGALMVVGVSSVGGVGPAITQLMEVQPGYLNWFPDGSWITITLFIIGWFFGGFAVLGQPQIIIRLVSMDPAASLNKMRAIYYGWFTSFYGATIIVGLLAHISLETEAAFDAETALPMMAITLLPDWAAGLILAALFAATLSTADSLVLASAAALTRDFGGTLGQSLWVAKGSTALVIIVATVIAITGASSVFALVLDAWGLLGAAFSPLMVIKMRGKKVSQIRASSMIVIGVGVFLGWQQAEWGWAMYAVAPGVMAGFMTFYLSGFATDNKNASLLQENAD